MVTFNTLSVTEHRVLGNNSGVSFEVHVHNITKTHVLPAQK